MTSTSSRTARGCSKSPRFSTGSTGSIRLAPPSDFRMQAFTEALAALGRPHDRLDRIQLLLSDPTTEPLEALDRKSAIGAYDRWSKSGKEARS